MSTYTGWNIYWIEEWTQFFAKCNWYTFHPILFEVEDERSMGGLELSLIVAGLGFRVRWNYEETEMVSSIIAMAKEYDEAGDKAGTGS